MVALIAIAGVVFAAVSGWRAIEDDVRAETFAAEHPDRSHPTTPA